MNKYIKYILGIVCLSGVIFASCDDVEDEVKSLKLDRLFSPMGVNVTVTGSVKMNLFWSEVKGAESYVVEIYTDSLLYTPETLVGRIETPTPSATYDLDGDMWYTARVKAISDNTGDSNWSDKTFRTGVADFFLASESGDIMSTSITMRWKPNTPATKINFKPGDEASISHTLTEQELATGVYTMEGLLPNTNYVVTLYNEERKVSVRAVQTIVDGATLVGPNDDLLQLIQDAEVGAAFMLEPGEYFVEGQILTLTKNVTFFAADENNKPLLHAQFNINGAVGVTLRNLLLDGISTTGNLDYIIQISANGNYDAITLEGCKIANYEKSILSASSSIKFVLNSFVIDNCFISNIKGASADGIDVRAGLIRNVNLKNSTFSNVVPSRDFIRLDDASTSYPGQTSNVNIANCTFYKVSNDATKRFLYVRFKENNTTIDKCIFADIAGFYSNQSATTAPVCNRNNYYNAEAFLEKGETPATKFDTSGNHTTLNPEFVDAEVEDFRVQNIALREIGDPRWKSE